MAADVQALNLFPYPRTHEVHIHCVYLATEAAHYVSPDERLSAERLLDTHKRSLFIASHSLLRTILAGYLGSQPEELLFHVGEHGKPTLSGSDATLHFNVSHSGSMFILAVAADREVGVDIEHIRGDTPFADMARLAFSPQEQAELFAFPDHLQRSAFYRCWTRKEAYLKASGMGFALPSNSFNVSLSPETPISLIAPSDLSQWSLQDIHAPEGYIAALAVQGAIPIIRYIRTHPLH